MVHRHRTRITPPSASRSHGRPRISASNCPRVSATLPSDDAMLGSAEMLTLQADPDELMRSAGAIGTHPIAQQAAVTEWRAMVAADRARRAARSPAPLHLIQADITANSASDRELLKRFTLFGPPAMLFFDASGKEIPGSRLVGEKNADEFLIHLNRHQL